MPIVAVVEKIKKNDAGYYNIQTDDGEWYGAGKFAPKFSEGDSIQFDFTENGKFKNLDFKSLEIVAAGEPKPAAAPAANKKWAPKKAGGGNSENYEARAKYWENKEKNDHLIQNEIRLQASRNAAIALLDVAIKNNLLEIPEPKKKGMDKIDVLAELVAEYTTRYYDETKNINATNVIEVEQEDFE